ncbi:lipocalin-like domain-containing protein [Pleomorphovibrio marinus]|uniref:lipocalin family protein n=1 Tax=Pleomorphovibrio marinus TaxID=2164132 RepID=UPI000E0AF6FC|nr:lipocalin family protein [Pleomorphovibrio marinus]
MDKIFFRIYICMAFAFAVACQDDFEQIDPRSILGTWEAVFLREDLDLDFVDTYVFFPNGDFLRTNTYREREGVTDIGYSYYLEGTYSLSGKEIQFVHEHELALEGGVYGPLESLPEVEGNMGRSAEVILSANHTQLTLEFPCLDVIGAMCGPPRVHHRVD